MSDAHPVLVTGATGMLGRAVVARLVAAGVPVRALTRQERPQAETVTWITGDVTTDVGIARAVEGVGSVVHLASAPYRRSYTRAVEIDGTRRLPSEALAAGIQHVIYTSIIGCDRIPGEGLQGWTIDDGRRTPGNTHLAATCRAGGAT